MRLVLLLALCLGLGRAEAASLSLPAALIDLASPAGQRIFLEAEDRAAYWPLSAQFETQENQAFCGVASLVMALNGLKVPAPAPAEYAPYRIFTQEDLFDAGGPGMLSAAWIAGHGLTLDQLGALAGRFGLKVRVVHARTGGLAAFRRDAAKALATPGQEVLVNFSRAGLGEEGGGHISPLAAYDAKSDRFLLLDVARYKYPPAWVRAADLYAALDTPDRSNGGAMRGYVVLTAAR
jgi:hypothetical protein